MKVNSKKLKKEVRNKFLDVLYAALEYAKSKNEIKSFVNDVLTESEKIMLGRRILIAQKLTLKTPYNQIVRDLGVGLDTIFRVQKWLGGRHRDYVNVIEKIKKKIRSNLVTKSEFKDYYLSGGFADLKRRYKSYYWLSDLLEEINKNKK